MGLGRQNQNSLNHKTSSGLFVSGNGSNKFKGGDQHSSYNQFDDSMAVINKDLIEESA